MKNQNNQHLLLRLLRTVSSLKYLVAIEKILAPNLLIYIYLQCVSSLSWSASTLATLTRDSQWQNCVYSLAKNTPNAPKFISPSPNVWDIIEGRLHGASIIMWQESSTYIHYEPSRMSQGKTPWKDPRCGFTGVWGVFSGERFLGKTPQTPVTPLGALSKGSFPRTSLTVHSLCCAINRHQTAFKSHSCQFFFKRKSGNLPTLKKHQNFHTEEKT